VRAFGVCAQLTGTECCSICGFLCTKHMLTRGVCVCVRGRKERERERVRVRVRWWCEKRRTKNT
jgi:hypothetical protein